MLGLVVPEDGQRQGAEFEPEVGEKKYPPNPDGEGGAVATRLCHGGIGGTPLFPEPMSEPAGHSEHGTKQLRPAVSSGMGQQGPHGICDCLQGSGWGAPSAQTL